MADWSTLPRELLTQIAKRLKCHWDIIRFQSVCSSWRSSVPSKPCCFPVDLPLDIRSFSFGHHLRLSAHTIFLIRSPGDHSQWLVKATEDIDGKMNLMNPLSNQKVHVQFKGKNLPKALDLMNFQVIELGHQYVLEQFFQRENPVISPVAASEVAVLWSSDESEDFSLLLEHNYWELVVYRWKDKRSTEVKSAPHCCITFASFRGKFYAIDDLGRTLAIDPSGRLNFLPNIESPSTRKVFVKSCDQLFLVNMFLKHDRFSAFPNSTNLKACLQACEDIVWFKVYKLDDRGQNWDELQSLGDRVLFLGKKGAFSGSASEFLWTDGNCIIFMGNLVYDDNKSDDMDAYMFGLEDGSVKPLQSCPSYSNLSWMPLESMQRRAH